MKVKNSPDRRGNGSAGYRTECAGNAGSQRMRRDSSGGYMKPVAGADIGTDSGSSIATCDTASLQKNMKTKIFCLLDDEFFQHVHIAIYHVDVYVGVNAFDASFVGKLPYYPVVHSRALDVIVIGDPTWILVKIV